MHLRRRTAHGSTYAVGVGVTRRSPGYVVTVSHALSRFLSAATAGYGGYALAQPAHLWQALDVDRAERPGLELLARTYGVRDLAISAAGVLGRSDATVRTAMRLRIACDLGDAALLAPRAGSPQARTKVLAVTLGWAALNALALTIDRRRAR
jgi:hypothetical protein